MNLVAKELKCKVQNYGIGGTRFAKQKIPSLISSYDLDFQMRAKSVDSDADFIFVFGGTNDWGHGDAPVGNINDDNPFTFCGAVNNVVKTLKNTCQNSKLVFILPLKRYGENSIYGEGGKKNGTLSLKGYVDLLKEIIEKKGIPFIDLYYDGLPEPDTDKKSKWFFDGVHPSDEGHAFIANRIVTYIRNNAF